ncbi:hypothetical protein F7725_028677 [Dissostichus mawsoni]|uniref:Uncharacterized protein n=1 Tax=Dissostichus mawsoni TaxID=36200 RepID=A0A7J5XHP2_DISMA|nr:hypothetical protein F7725_028677 [Dissostichus mawsoni]
MYVYQYLGWHADWSLHLQALLLSPTDQRFYIAAGEGDADAVNGNLSLNRCLASVLESLKKRVDWLQTSHLAEDWLQTSHLTEDWLRFLFTSRFRAQTTPYFSTS